MRHAKLAFILLIVFFTSKLSYAQDWGNLKRFQEENAKLTITEPGKGRIVFMGNSIAEGWSNHRPEFFSNKPYINRGISG